MSDFELIDAYLRDELSEKERKRVEQRTEKNKAFAKLVQERKLIIDGIRSAALEEQARYLKNLEKDISNQEYMDRENNRIIEGIQYAGRKSIKKTLSNLEDTLPRIERPVRRKVLNSQNLSIAATILLIPIVFWLVSDSKMSSNPLSKISNDWFEPYQQSVITRSTHQKSDAYLLYENKKFKQAIPALQALFEKDGSIDHLFFLGNSFLAIKQPDKALEHFNLYSKEEVPFPEPLDWYVALAYLQKGDENMARYHLDQIIDDQHWVKKRDSLLRDLEERKQ